MASSIRVSLRLGIEGSVVTTIDLKHVLLWCVGLNYLVLFVWFGVFVFAHDWMYGMHMGSVRTAIAAAGFAVAVA
jgi:hypothetical protein